MINPHQHPKRCLHLCASTLAITAAVLMHPFALQPAYADEFPLGFHTYSIPAGSMKPTLLIGDYAVAISASEPKRGDVVTYRHPRDPSTTYVKRIVGLGGERIQMVDGVLHINGQAVKRERIADYVDVGPEGRPTAVKRWRETLPNGVSYEILDLVDNGFYDNTPVYAVPTGHFFMLGDNRDNSTDSRVTSQHGTVPAANVEGQMVFIYFSIAEGEAVWRVWRLPWSIRWGRLFSEVH